MNEVFERNAEGETMSDIGGMLHKVTGNGLGLGHLKAAAPVSETTAPSPATSTVPATVPALGDVVVDDITLSDEAQDFVSGAPTTGPGKSHMSPAHRAMAELQGNEDLAGLPFGKIVSTLARGGDINSLLPPTTSSETDETSTVAPATETDPEAEETVPVSTETPTPVVLPEVPDLVVAPEDTAIVDLLEAIANPEEDETAGGITDLFEIEDGADPELG